MSSPSLENIYGQNWTGTIASDAEWRSNQTASLDDEKAADFFGYSYRCKVRIHKLDPCSRTELLDNELRWAVISLPTTGGSGISGEKTTPSIHPGDIVKGTWIRQDDGPAIPVVYALLPAPKNIQDVPSTQNDDGCKRYTHIRNSGVPSYSRDESGKLINPSVGAGAGNKGSRNQRSKESENVEIPCPGQTNAAAMQGRVQSAIDQVNNFQAKINTLSASAVGEITELQKNIDNELQRAAEWLSGHISEMAKKIMERVIGLINKATQPAGVLLPLNTRWAVREASNVAVEACYCLFAKVLKALTGLIKNWLQSLVNTFFGIPICVIENLLKNLIGQLLAALRGLLSSLGGIVTSLIGSVTGFINQVLDFVKDLLELFNCDEKEKCPETREWNIMEGGQSTVSLVNLDINGIINGAKSVYSSFASVFSSFDLSLFDPLLSFNLSSSLASAFSTCSGFPYVCGPPIVGFWGGGAIKHATATPIISASGGILSISVTSGGFGYTHAPFVSIKDPCGLGAGAVAFASTGPGGVVSSVTVVSSGVGYTPSPSAFVGTPAGPLAAAPAIVVPPAPAGVLPAISVVAAGSSGIATSGSLISLSPSSSTCMTLSSGFIVCPGFSTVTTSTVSFTVPSAGPGVGVSGFGVPYSVSLYLCDVLIRNPGFGYLPTDKVVITPSNGASAELVVGSFGEITAINILNGGSGFTSLPTITINSSTGYNADLIPQLCSIKIGDGIDLPDGGLLPPGVDPNSVIQVVDCVGKVVAPV